MISLGKNIRRPNDPLEKIPLRMLADKIRNPNQKFVDYILQLRNVLAIDVKKYRELKTRLPYVIAALFNPPYRKISNFAQTRYFILDIDHLESKDIDIKQIKARLKEDSRLALMFESPSGEGLKLFFKTAEPFRDAGKYTLFYKAFAMAFASEYSITQVIDKRTSDVSRACFVSYDPDLYYNEKPEAVQISKYVDFDNEVNINDLEALLKETAQEQKIQMPAQSSSSDVSNQDLDSRVIQEIRERLNPKLVTKREKKIIIPPELENIVEKVEKALEKAGIEVEEIVGINYGKQFRMKAKHLKAEINVFYGRKGFSVVKSTKSAVDEALTDLAHDIIANVLFGDEEE